MKALTIILSIIFAVLFISCEKENVYPIVQPPIEEVKTATVTLQFSKTFDPECRDDAGDSLYFENRIDYPSGSIEMEEYTFEIPDNDTDKLWSLYFYSTCGYGVQIKIESEVDTFDNYGIYVNGSSVFSFYLKDIRIEVL